MNQQQGQLNPYAVMAAILFNLGKTEKIKIKPDDSQEEVEIEARLVGLERDEDALVCVIPMAKIMFYQQHLFDFKLRLDNGHAIISLEKRENKAGLLSANGDPIIPESTKIQELLERFK